MDEEKKVAEEAGAEPEVESAAARRLRALGISTEPEPPTEPIKKAGFFENFWYHHKWGFIAAVFGIFVVGVGIFQLVTKIDPDVYLMYAGPVYFDSGETDELIDAITDNMPYDFNGDGKKQVSVMQAMYLSKSKIEQYSEEAEEAGYSYSHDASFNAAELKRIKNEFMMSTSVLLLMDPAVYDEFKGQSTLMTLEEMLGYTPDAAIDRFGVKFSELEFKKYYPVFDSLPEDTVLAVRRPTGAADYGSRDAEDVVEDHVELLREILEFRPPAEE